MVKAHSSGGIHHKSAHQPQPPQKLHPNNPLTPWLVKLMFFFKKKKTLNFSPHWKTAPDDPTHHHPL